MDSAAAVQTPAAHWEHFDHGAAIGVRGLGPTKAAAFEQVASSTQRSRSCATWTSKCASRPSTSPACRASLIHRMVKDAEAH
jgi:tRNA nucleotidyltransferase (CCA-adding enzyme)